MAIFPAKKFQRRKENFVCDKCGENVQGNGYTNHCPKCLWSKHVDIHPGDRASFCQGMMEPVDLILKAGTYYLLHCCAKCGFAKRNKLAAKDNFQAALRIAKNKN